MPIYRLSDELWFPGPEEFEDNLIAVGGDLTPSRLLLAYSKGIFPWYSEPGDIHWYCPEERCVFHVPSFKPSKSLRTLYNKGTYTITFDQAFYDVIFKCSGIRFDNSPSDLLGDKRSEGTWILPEIIEAYDELHQLGFAHSVEVWEDGWLVGGLYGVSLGGMFCGESMFSRRPNASKLALWHLVQRCSEWGFEYIDAQMPNPHLMSMGAKLISRPSYLEIVDHALKQKTHRGKW